tara:strand:+ start:126 stop:854 length:729 start_codon:yes stop_codon:yes gene_type:complete
MSLLDSQKTQSVVGIANLAQNKQINKSLQELKKSQEEAAKNAKLQADLQKEANKLEQRRVAAAQDAAKSAELQLQIQQQAEQRKVLKEEQEEREKKELKFKKQTVFNARQDIKTTLNSKNNPIEKFFDLNSIAVSLIDANITSDDFDDYDDKQYLSETNSELNEAIDNTHESMSEEEINDLQTINKVLSVNEESKIKNLEKKIKKENKTIEDWEYALNNLETMSLETLEGLIELMDSTKKQS